MGQSIIPAEHCERPTIRREDNEDTVNEPEGIVLEGQEADDFADMVLSRPPKRSEALTRAFDRRRRMIVSE